MKTTSDTRQLNFDDPGWYFLLEYPLNLLDANPAILDDPKTSMFIQTIVDLGVRPDLLNNIMRKLVSIAKGVTAPTYHSSQGAPVNIRLYCPKNARMNESPATPARRTTADTASKSILKIHKTGRGWEYLLVERGGHARPGVRESIQNWIDMYLYPQGGQLETGELVT